MEIKQIARQNWQRILERRSAYGHVRAEDFEAEVGLLTMDRVKTPLAFEQFGSMMQVVGDGYCWLQIAPKGETWWLTAMFNEREELIQYYFDMTKENVLSGAESYCYDLYLDVVFLPDGRSLLLDQDELEEAVRDGDITAQDAMTAQATARMLMDGVPTNIQALNRFCWEQMKLLKKEL